MYVCLCACHMCSFLRTFLTELEQQDLAFATRTLPRVMMKIRAFSRLFNSFLGFFNFALGVYILDAIAFYSTASEVITIVLFLILSIVLLFYVDFCAARIAALCWKILPTFTKPQHEHDYQVYVCVCMCMCVLCICVCVCMCLNNEFSLVHYSFFIFI